MKIGMQERFERKFMPEPMSGCWLWTAHCNKDGYGTFWDGERRSAKAHQTAFEIYKGEIPENKCVLHRCDVRSCVNPSHLFIGTHSQNMEDMKQKARGNGPLGELAHKVKLNRNQVIAIRNDGRNPKVIAGEYGVHWSQIYRLKSRKSWGWL